MNKQANEAREVIAPANKQDNPPRYGDDDPIFPNGVTVGATIKFKTFRSDETVVTSTRFVTGGDNNHLTIADYTGKPSEHQKHSQYPRMLLMFGRLRRHSTRRRELHRNCRV